MTKSVRNFLNFVGSFYTSKLEKTLKPCITENASIQCIELIFNLKNVKFVEVVSAYVFILSPFWSSVSVF